MSDSAAVDVSSKDDGAGEGRKRLLISNDSKNGQKMLKSSDSNKSRWCANQITEDLVKVVGDIMYPNELKESFSVDVSNGQVALSRMNTLGYLKNPLRRKHPIESWTPLEIALFEASVALYGKRFTIVQTQIKTKTTKEIIEFYYYWKKTNHYKQWKAAYIPDSRDTPTLMADVDLLDTSNPAV